MLASFNFRKTSSNNPYLFTLRQIQHPREGEPKIEHRKLTAAFDLSGSEIENLYAEMYKTTEDSRRVNCRACGFHTCEQMVAAIILGMRQKSDCVQYLRVVEMQPAAETVALMHDVVPEIAESLCALCSTIESETTRVLASFDSFNQVMQKVDGTLQQLVHSMAQFLRPK